MTAGATYPIQILREDGEIDREGSIVFTDSSDQPAGGSSPFVAPAAGTVTVAEYSNAAPAIIVDDDTEHGVEIHSKDNSSILTIANGGAVVEGPWLFDNSLVTVDSIVGQIGVAALAPFGRLTSKYTITAGALPDLGAWVSGTAKVNPVTRQITVNLEITTDGTANDAVCTIEISPDDATYTTLGTPGASSAVNTVGQINLLVPVTLPEGWHIKLTLDHCTVDPSIYY